MTQTTKPTLNQLEYPLVAGFIHDWLVAGPCLLPVAEHPALAGAEWKAQVAAHYRRAALPFADQPAEQTRFTIADAGGDQTFTWTAHHCADDHFVNLTGFYHTGHYLCAWAYAELETPSDCVVTATLTSNGPSELWLNGESRHRQTEFRLQLPYRQSFALALSAGRNRLLVQIENVAARACPFVLALQLTGAEQDAIKVSLPSAMPQFERRQRLAAIFAPAYLEQNLYHREQEIKLAWPDDVPVAGEITVRLQSTQGRIYAEAQSFVRPGTVVNLGKAYQCPEGAYQVVLMPKVEEYYEHGLRLQRRIPLYIANGKF